MPAGLANKVFNVRRTGHANLGIINPQIVVVPKSFQQVEIIYGIFIQKLVTSQSQPLQRVELASRASRHSHVVFGCKSFCIFLGEG
jgi:hypothetical protein